MFGYITAYKDQMKEEDQKTYEAYYCGLCRTLGKRFGKKSQLILSYDLVFLAILINGLYEEPETQEESFCILKGHKVLIKETDALSYAADINLLLSYQNYRDQVHDSASKKAVLAVRLLKKSYEETKQRYERQTKALEQYMKALSACEAERDENPDRGANLTGEMLQEVFLMRDDEYARYLRPLFYYLGKFIYLSDAYQDVEKDAESGDYNPYAALQNDPAFDDRVLSHLESVMGECVRSFEMLPLFRHRAILQNILYAGVWLNASKTRQERLNRKKDVF